MSETGFALRREGPVAVLTFNRPDRLNALAKPHMIAFGQACHDLAEDPGVRCVLVTGEGRAFCAGADVSGQRTASLAAFARPARFKDTRLDFITPLLNLPKPTVAAVNGVAVGAGLGIALGCDIRICGESGAFLPNFCDLGISAVDGVPWLLSRLTGVSRALEMLYTGDRIDSRRAEAAGLVNRIVPDARLMDEALALARRIAAKAPVGIQMTKAAVVNGHGRTWPEALAQQELAYVTTTAFSSHDIEEAGLARTEKRAAIFTDSIPFGPDLSVEK